MTEGIRMTLAILRQAMKLELQGYRFYLRAARTTKDEKGQEIFIALAGDERKHFNLVKRQHTALTTKGRWVDTSGITAGGRDPGKPIFPKGREALEKVVGVESGERDALLYGMDVETKSYDLYLRAASEIESPMGKQMCEFLAGQEQSHLNILLMRYDAVFGPVGWRY